MKMRRKIAFFLILVLVLQMFAASFAVSAASRAGSSLLDDCTTADAKKYILSAIDYYCSIYGLNDTTVVFMFEGANKNAAPYALGGVRNQAIAVVVKQGAITYVYNNCSTIPDNPEKNYGTDPSAPTVLDDIYPLTTINHGYDQHYAAFSLAEKPGISCVRLNSNTGEIYTSEPATYIHLHSRWGMNASITDNAISSGCLLAGTKTDFYTFVNAVAGSSFNSNTSQWGQVGTQCGYIIIDRQLAKNNLKNFIYGNYQNAVKTITKGSQGAAYAGLLNGTGLYYVTSVGDQRRIRKEATTSSKILCTLPKDAYVWVTSSTVKISDGFIWYKVNARGETGWVAVYNKTNGREYLNKSSKNTYYCSLGFSAPKNSAVLKSNYNIEGFVNNFTDDDANVEATCVNTKTSKTAFSITLTVSAKNSVSLKETAINKIEKEELRLKKLPKGEYKLTIKVTYKINGKKDSTTSTHTFTIG